MDTTISERERERRAQQRAQSITTTVRGAANMTGLGVSTIWKLIKDGRLTTTSVGSRRLIFIESIERLLKDAA